MSWSGHPARSSSARVGMASPAARAFEPLLVALATGHVLLFAAVFFMLDLVRVLAVGQSAHQRPERAERIRRLNNTGLTLLLHHGKVGMQPRRLRPRHGREEQRHRAKRGRRALTTRLLRATRDHGSCGGMGVIRGSGCAPAQHPKTQLLRHTPLLNQSRSSPI